MTTKEWLALVGILIPVLTGIGWLIFKIGSLHSTIEAMKGPVSRLAAMETMVNELWRRQTTVNHSPTVLNAKGKKIIKDSKIDLFTQKYFDEIVLEVDNLNPDNAYDAQEILISVLSRWRDKPEVKEEIHKALRNSWTDMDTLLFDAAIDLRDRVIKELDFKRSDIDKFDPNK